MTERDFDVLDDGPLARCVVCGDAVPVDDPDLEEVVCEGCSDSSFDPELEYGPEPDE